MIANVFIKIGNFKKVLAEWGSDEVISFEHLHPSLEEVFTREEQQDLNDVFKELKEYKDMYSVTFDSLVKAGISFSIEPELKRTIDI